MLLDGLRVVTTALNLPGPAACARLRELGATVAKVEPPTGDPMERFNASWYGKLHEGVTIGRLDLKSDEGRRAMGKLLDEADLLITAQRASALDRMGLGPDSLARDHPRLCHVAITGHASPGDELAGHDLTYLAAHGLVVPPAMPRTLYADVAGAERAVSTALALVIARDRTGKAHRATAALADAAAALAQPLHQGLTRPGAILGGGNPAYNLYAAREGWIAVAALEPHFEKKLGDKFALGKLTIDALRSLFASHDAEYWEEWGRRNDIPIVAVRETSES
jgi:alpha-methylacyl-CoA racemase